MGDPQYFTLRRTAQTWQLENSYETRELIEAGVGEAALSAGLTLDSPGPYTGWVSDRHSRDGKFWPCREMTAGARPAWIWVGR